jgi:hypothetical protein
MSRTTCNQHRIFIFSSVGKKTILPILLRIVADLSIIERRTSISEMMKHNLSTSERGERYPPEDPQNLRGQTVVHLEKPQKLLSTQRVPLTGFTCAGEKLKLSNLARTFYSTYLGTFESNSCQGPGDRCLQRAYRYSTLYSVYISPSKELIV